LNNNFVGWERNVQSKLGPRISDLGPQTHKVTGKITKLVYAFFFFPYQFYKETCRCHYGSCFFFNRFKCYGNKPIYGLFPGDKDRVLFIVPIFKPSWRTRCLHE
jgi:hypothetical protein